MIVGKGAAYARAEREVRDFIDKTRLPFLASPMGKGVVPDDHRLSVASARSYALQNADVVLLIGARLNWILHFGLPPRFAPGVRVIQIDVSAEEIGTNVPAEAALVGDAKAIVGQLNQAVDRTRWSYATETPWRVALRRRDRAEPNAASRRCSTTTPCRWATTACCARSATASRATRSSRARARTRWTSGARCCRTSSRASAWTPAASAPWAWVWASRSPPRPCTRAGAIVAVEGDSAFGFSGMEVETACRYQLPITFVILNNNGIGGGVDEIDLARGIPPSVYTPRARYERVIEAFGGRGFFVEKPDELALRAEGGARRSAPDHRERDDRRRARTESPRSSPG